MPRLFTALEIPREAALSLSLLRGGLPGARTQSVENYHMRANNFAHAYTLADELIGAFDRIDRQAFSAHPVRDGSHSAEETAFDLGWRFTLRRAHGRCRPRSNGSVSAMGLPPDHAPVLAARDPRAACAMHGSAMSSPISAGRGDFRTLPFDVGRFVVMSSRDSVGGGPYLVEEAYPLGWRNSLPSLDTSSVQPARNN